MLTKFAPSGTFTRATGKVDRATSKAVGVILTNVPDRIARVRIYIVGGLHGEVTDFCATSCARRTSAVQLSTKGLSTNVFGDVRARVFGHSYATYRKKDARPTTKLCLARNGDCGTLISIMTSGDRRKLGLIGPKDTRRDFLRIVLRRGVIGCSRAGIVAASDALALLSS